MKLEVKNEILAKSLNGNANTRLGVEIVSNSESSSELLDDSDDAPKLPNTHEFQRDSEFTEKYFYITNVML